MSFVRPECPTNEKSENSIKRTYSKVEKAKEGFKQQKSPDPFANLSQKAKDLVQTSIENQNKTSELFPSRSINNPLKRTYSRMNKNKVEGE